MQIIVASLRAQESDFGGWAQLYRRFDGIEPNPSFVSLLSRVLAGIRVMEFLASMDNNRKRKENIAS